MRLEMALKKAIKCHVSWTGVCSRPVLLGTYPSYPAYTESRRLLIKLFCRCVPRLARHEGDDNDFTDVGNGGCHPRFTISSSPNHSLADPLRCGEPPVAYGSSARRGLSSKLYSSANAAVRAAVAPRFAGGRMSLARNEVLALLASRGKGSHGIP